LINGVQQGPDETFIGGQIAVGNFGRGYFGLHFLPGLDVQVGDDIGLKVWASAGGAGLDLMDVVVHTFPIIMRVSSISLMVNALADEEGSLLYAILPAGSLATIRNEQSIIATYTIGGITSYGGIANFGNDITAKNFVSISSDNRSTTSRSLTFPRLTTIFKYRSVS